MTIGIIGCGTITVKRHAPEYAANPDAEITGWFDVARDKAERLAKIYGGRVFSDWRELIDSNTCEAVSVCTPNDTHSEIAIYALEHGLHVLCEKPMATSLDKCREMVYAARKSGKILFIGQNQRMLGAHKTAREIIARGELGKILSVQTSFGHAGPESWANTKDPWFFDKRRAAFGAMFDLGIHKVDVVRFLLNDDIDKVAAFCGTLDKKMSSGEPIGVDDNAVAVFQMKNGAFGQLTASWTQYARESNCTRVYGSKGMLCIFEDGKSPLVFTGLDGKDVNYDVGGIQTNDDQFSSGIIDAFVRDAVNNGAAEVSGEDVCRSMTAVFAMLESARDEKYVSIEY